MPPLRNLEAIYPSIDANFQQFCASHGIFSVEDFLIHDLSELVSLAEAEASSKMLKEGSQLQQLIRQRECWGGLASMLHYFQFQSTVAIVDTGISQILCIMDSQHGPWLNGVELLEDAMQNKHFLPTGCKGIDMLLGGGLRVGQLTEIVGPSSSGKTQVCLHIASHVADKNMGGVMFLDTCNSFSPHRISCIVNQSSSSFAEEVKLRRLKRIMSGILCQPVYDLYALLDVLRRLEFTLKVKREDAKMCLLIVDSVSSLITPILGGKDSQGRALMVSAGFLLKKLADKTNLAVLVTNHMVGAEGGNLKPALGESWKSIPHVRLLSSRDQWSNICRISVLKHTSVACGRRVEFVITDETS